MGLLGNFTAIFVILTAIIIYSKLKPIIDYPEKPEIGDIWWGPGDPNKVDTSIKSFSINVPDNVLEDLQERLSNHIPFQAPLEGAKQNYGINTKLFSTIVDFWKKKYNWREREKFLNQFPQFKVNIQGLNIHYIHVKPQKTKGVKILPLLLLHGWPGSVREFYEIIPILTRPRKRSNIAFEVIAPSLPGYGFSDGAVRPGLNTLQMANIFKNLMSKIGFEKYYIQGGDWGGLIVQILAAMFPDKVIGVHSNMCVMASALQFIKVFIGSYFPSLIGILKDQEEYLYPMSEKYSDLVLETGYFHIQATKPDTLGISLRDSPVGLAAYIIEKFSTWTNTTWKNLDDGGLTQKFSYTNLLDNVMIYWVTRSITTSVRLYSETFNKASSDLEVDRLPIEVPSGCARFKFELANQPDVILKEKFLNLVHSADYDGGHFPAFEIPQVLAEDIFQFVEKVKNLKTVP